MGRSWNTHLLGLLLAAASGGFYACATSAPEQELSPYRSMLEVIAELESGIGSDLYRFDPPTDVIGQNLFRSSLARLDRIQKLIPDPDFLPSIQFAKARCQERLFNFDIAADLYRQVGTSDTLLAERARQLEPFARGLAEILVDQATDTGLHQSEAVLARVDRRRESLVRLLDQLDDTPRRSLVLASVERLDVREREFLWRSRTQLRDGANAALAVARRVAQAHAESHRRWEHFLRLADMYTELARSYVAASDPAEFRFDAAYARNLIQAASRAYGEVAVVDGRLEREEARAGLLALDGLAERISGGAP